MANQETQQNEQQNQLLSIIHHEAHHAVEEIIGNPAMVRKLVGETIRHLGISLTALSTQYLPLYSREFMVPPEPIKDSRDAVVLTLRPIQGDNAFQVLATAKKDKEELVIDVTLFRPHLDNLGHSTFYVYPEEFQQELLRQLTVLIKSEGSAVFQAIVLKDFFQPVDPDTPEVNPVEPGDEVMDDAPPDDTPDTPLVTIGDEQPLDTPILVITPNTSNAATSISHVNVPFKCGDTVMLKSGGPGMTVSAEGVGGELECTWYDRNEMRSSMFSAQILKAVNT